jgi:hypothetical protein
MTSPFQFSLRSMMLVVAAVAVLAALTTMPYALASSILLLASFAMPPALVLGVKHPDRDLRAFCTGAILPATILALGGVATLCLWSLSSESFDWRMRRLLIRDQCLIVFGLAILSGTVCLLIQRAGSGTAGRLRRPMRSGQPVFRIMLQFGGGPRDKASEGRDPRRARRRRHRYELTRRLGTGGELLVQAEYLSGGWQETQSSSMRRNRPSAVQKRNQA